MRYLVAAIGLLLCMGSLTAKAYEQISGFQNLKFGSTYEEVKKVFPKVTEKRKTKGYEELAAVPSIEIAGGVGTLSFNFTSDKLYQVAVIQTVMGRADEAPMTEFERLRKLLKEKYGPPSESSTERKIVSGNDMTSLKIGLGEHQWRTRWTDKENGNTVTLVLMGGGFKKEIGILYLDKKLNGIAEKAKNSAFQKDL